MPIYKSRNQRKQEEMETARKAIEGATDFETLKEATLAAFDIFRNHTHEITSCGEMGSQVDAQTDPPEGY